MATAAEPWQRAGVGYRRRGPAGTRRAGPGGGGGVVITLVEVLGLPMARCYRPLSGNVRGVPLRVDGRVSFRLHPLVHQGQIPVLERKLRQGANVCRPSSADTV